MKKLIIFYFIIFFSLQNSFSQNLPKEWIILFDCIQTNQKKLSPEIFNAINSNIRQFNTSLNHISPERINSFMKAMLYRQLLETPPTFTRQKKDARSIVYIEKFFADYDKNIKPQGCTFTNWLIEAMQSDFRNIKNLGGLSNSSLSSAKNPLEAKGVTIQYYVSNWVDFLQKSMEEKDVLLINYYGSLIVRAEKILRNFTHYAPTQPTTINYLNWTFSDSFFDKKILSSPNSAPKVESEKSASEILEKNIPATPETNKTKTEAIDELIKKKKLEVEVEMEEF